MTGAFPSPATIPRLTVLTDRRACDHPLVEVVSAAVAGGARMVVLREKDLPANERDRLAEAIAEVLAPVDGLLVMAGPWPAAAAVHLAAGDPMPVPRPALVGRSCHHAAEIATAGLECCDWITVSPFSKTPSKPGYGPALGPAGLAALVAAPGVPPAYALGGVTAANARQCLAAGAYGVAVMGAVMRAAQPDQLVADLLAELAA